MNNEEDDLASLEYIEHALERVLSGLGVNTLDDPQTIDTAKRWAKVLWEFRPKTGGVPNLKAFPNEGYTGMVYDRCEFYSLCSHHMLPVIGTVHLAYLPGKQVLGLSKLSRVADFFARQPTMQEELTQRIADYLQALCQPKGVAVFIEAKHLCKCMRGVSKQDGLMCTTVLKGKFLKDAAARQEFQTYCGRPS